MSTPEPAPDLNPYAAPEASLEKTPAGMPEELARIDAIRRNGFRAAQIFSAPVNTAVLRLAIRDERTGKSGSIEIRLPLASAAAGYEIK